MENPANEQISRPWLRLMALLALGALIFGVNLGGYDLWPPDEPRFGQVAREMLDSGDGVLLTVNGEPYKEKPPMLFWAMAALSAPFGDVSETTARMPSVLAALVTLVVTFLIARRLYGGRTALWSVAILIACFKFWWQSRTAQTDMLLTAWVALAAWGFLEWHRSRAFRWLVVHALFTAAAVYTKGPPGFMIPALLVATFYWRGSAKDSRDNRRAAGVVIWISFIVSAGLIALWLVPAYTHAAEIRPAVPGQAFTDNLFRQTVGRFALGVSKAQWPWYYLANLPVDWLPWSLFLPLALPWWWRNRKADEGMRFLMAWVVPAVVVFSLSVGKRQLYLLPLYPAMAILWARALLALIAAPGEATGRTWTRIWMGLVAFGILAAPVDPGVLVISAFGLLALASGSTIGRTTGYCQAGFLISLGIAPMLLPFTPEARLWTPGLMVFGVVALVLGGETLWRTFRNRDIEGALRFTAVRFASVFFMAALWILPAINQVKGASVFCEPVRALTEQGQDFRLYSVGFSREEYIYYAKRPHTPVFTGLIQMDLPSGMTLEDLALLQKRLRDDIVDAVEEVVLASPEAITDGEVQTLREAVERAVIEDHNVAPAHAELFEAGLTHAIGTFQEEVEKEGTALFFVQEEDWRWLVAFRPELRRLHVVQSGTVGSRNVLLVANKPVESLPGGAERDTLATRP